MHDDGTYCLPLYAKDKSVRRVALIDAQDAEWANQWRWRFMHWGLGYAGRSWLQNGHTHAVALHRAILGLTAGSSVHVDHVNHDTLDNRRANLRLVTPAQNQQNRLSVRGSSSQYRGVGYLRNRGKWEASAKLNGERFYLGMFSDEKTAAAVVAKWRAEHMPFTIERSVIE